MTSDAVHTFVIDPIWKSESGRDLDAGRLAQDAGAGRRDRPVVEDPERCAWDAMSGPSARRAARARRRRRSRRWRWARCAARAPSGVAYARESRRRSPPLTSLRAGVVGTGFVGVVHVHALRLLGVEVAGLVGSSPERAAAKAVAPVYESLEALLADPSVDVVHLTTPNHLHHPQSKQVLEAGKHVVCEKPLAMTSDESAELVALAESSGLVHSTNFNLRFFPLVHEARARVAAGELGDVWNVHGGYLQDWLLYPTDWNWRLEPDKGGALRAIGDIGSHWMDMAQFVTGSGSSRSAPISTRRSPCAGGRRRGRDVRERGRCRARGRAP